MFSSFGKRRTNKYRVLRIYLCTWNVGGKRANDTDVLDLLSLGDSPRPDVYCIGLQEVDTGDADSEKNSWVEAITARLAAVGFVRIKTRRMNCIITFLFVQREHLAHIISIESETTKTGWGGWWGNKGGVSVRMDAYGVNVIIVNSHLAAHQDAIDERIKDFDAILEDQKFKDEDVENILDHDYVFWIGDLNFRIDGNDREEVIRKIGEGNWSDLVKEDQLNKCRERQLIFDGFCEEKLDFPPTYKFDVGTQMYDTSSKKRIPAWCDRILWHVYHVQYGRLNLDVQPIKYKSHPEYTCSDHKPVSACFDIRVFCPPPPMPVKFHLIPKWIVAKDSRFSYKLQAPFPTFASDWIGLYQSDFVHFGEYKGYEMADPGAGKRRQSMPTEILFRGRNLKVSPGRYVLCYLRKNYSILGISREFQIRP